MWYKATLIFMIIFLIIAIFVSIYYFIYAVRITLSKSQKAPYIPTFDRHLTIMKNLKIKPNSTMVDLGCGDGKALRFFSTEHKIKLWEWYDINLYAVLKGRRLNKHQKITNIKLYRKNLFDVDLKKYDYIYVYLRDTQLAIMEDWIFNEKKKETIIISNSFQFTNHKPFQTYKNDKWFETIFLYK